MKTLIFFEVNEQGLPFFHRLPILTESGKIVFDTINNLGAVTESQLRRRLPDLSRYEISAALNELLRHNVIIRRVLEADDDD